MVPLPNSSPGGRCLAELLQEQQAPFLLDVYLLEHGCSRTALCPEATPVCWPRNACRRLQGLARRGLRRRRKGILSSLLALFVNWRYPNASNWNRKALEEEGHPYKWRKPGSSTDHLPFSSRKVDGDLGEIKVDAERNQERECTEEAKQPSPVSVLELHSDDDSPVHGRTVGEEDPSIISGLSSPLEVSDILEEFHGSTVASKRMRTERVLRGTMQLLSACVGFEDEHRIGYESEHTDQYYHEVLGSHRTGLTRCSRACTRRTRAGEEVTMDRLIESDVSECTKEWREFHSYVMEISAEIGDEIFDDLKQQFVSHMVVLFSRWRRC